MNASRLVSLAQRILLFERSRESSYFRTKTKPIIFSLHFFFMILFSFFFLQSAFFSEAASTERISIATDGTQANADSDRVTTSTDGRFVAFVSWASNLVANDTNAQRDIFVYDRQTDSLERISVASNGDQANNWSDQPDISGDGRYVVFSSAASNLVLNDTNSATDVFIHDRQTHVTERMSVSNTGVQGNSSSFDPAITPDGGYVAFASHATNLVSFDWNAKSDIFLYKRDERKIRRVNIPSCYGSGSAGCVEANGDSKNPDITKSPDSGSILIAFESTATNLVLADTNAKQDVFLIATNFANTTYWIKRISIKSSWASPQSNGNSWGPSIDANGWYIAYSSAASNLVDGDTNNKTDVFVFAQGTGAFSERVSVNSSSVQGNDHSGGPILQKPSISLDGRFVAFASQATNLISADTNASRDIFVRDRTLNKTYRVSLTNTGTGTQSNGISGGLYGPAMSGNGKFINFSSSATNLVSSDTNNRSDIFARDWMIPVVIPPNPTA